MSRSKYDVGFRITVVPDSFTSAGACRLSLQIVPKPDPIDEPTVDIRNWPQLVAKMSRCMRVAVGKLAFTGSTPAVSGQEYVTGTVQSDLSTGGATQVEDDDQNAAAASELWREIFTAGDSFPGEGFDQLIVALRGQAAVVAMSASTKLDIVDYPSADIGDLMDTLTSSAVAVTLHQRWAKRLAVEVPLAAGDTPPQWVDPDAIRPSVAWWRWLYQNWFNSGAFPPPPAQDRIDRARALLSAPTLANALPFFRTPARSAALRTAAGGFRARSPFHAFWQRKATPIAPAERDSAAIRDEMSNFAKVWGLGAERVDPPSLATECQEIKDRASSRKFAGILSYPTLSKFFRLIVDLEVARRPLERLLERVADRAYGVIAAEFVTGFCPPKDHAWADKPVIAKLHWTAAVVGKSAVGSGSEYFGPCSLVESKEKAPIEVDQFRDGIVNLNVTLADGSPRFKVVSQDVTNAVMRWRMAASEIVAAAREGMQPEDQSTRIPEETTRGLSLFDLGIKESTVETWASNRAGRLVSFASDLFQGYRFDAAVMTSPRTRDCDQRPPQPAADWKSPGRWRSLMNRQVDYPSKVSAAFLRRVDALRCRDDGRVRTATGTTRYRDPDTGEYAYVHLNDEVFTWTGESLATPSLHHNRRTHNDDPHDGSVWVDGKVDLGLNLEFDLPNAAAGNGLRGLPPLREGRSYIFGARACWMNGCGHSLSDAVERYIGFAKPVVLGQSAGVAICFQRRAQIEAPDVLLPSDDVLVSSRLPARDAPGETSETLVIRSGVRQTPSARRMLMPGRVSFDASEQAGVFDCSDDRQPRGAFAGRIRFRSCPDNGTFPVARAGKWEFPGATGDGAANPPAGGFPRAPDEPERQPSRGTVLVVDASAPAPDEPFYPDPIGSHVCARFARDKAQAPHFADPARPTPFWEGVEPEAATPIVLELRRPKRGEELSRRGWFGDERSALVRQLSGGAIRVPTISVVLKPAEDVELELWPHSSTPDLCAGHSVLARGIEAATSNAALKAAAVTAARLKASVRARFFEGLQALRAGTEQGRKILDDLLCTEPLPPFNNVRTVRVVHAVDRPLARPAFESKPRKNSRLHERLLQFRAVVITAAPDADDPGSGLRADLKSWAAYVLNHREIETIDWPSEEGGSTTFFVGSVALNRPSTVSLRAEAEWREFEPAGAVFDPKQRKWRFQPRRVPATQLFAITDIATDDVFRDEAVDLLNADILLPPTPAAAYRGLSYAFLDGKARHLRVKLIGTSRFTKYFPAETEQERRSAEVSGVGKYEADSEAPADIWVPATFRPREPEIDRIMPVFEWKIDSEFAAKTIRWTRKAFLRVYMSRESWYSTGECEQLAVAFGPFENSEGTKLDLCAFEEEVKEFGQFVSRWGADPIHVSGGLADLMPVDQLDGGAQRERLRLPFAVEAEVIDVMAPCRPGEELPTGTTFPVLGTNFITGVTVCVNGEEADAKVIDSVKIDVTLRRPAKCPLDVVARNPSLFVTIKAFEPVLDPDEGLWYTDLRINPAESYNPFIQFGLARYQPNCAPGLHLSRPRAVWAQVPAHREGCVTFTGDRTIVVEHSGIGYGTAQSNVPLLSIRLLRASHPGRVPQASDGSVGWTPVVDSLGQPRHKLRIRPHHDGHRVWWSEAISLPPPRPGMRYGLQIEEIETFDADPEPTAHPNRWRHKDGVLSVDLGEDDRSMFLHVVDLGE